LDEFVRDAIWLYEYPIRFAGTRFNARMTVVRLRGGRLMIHSPAPLDDALVAEIQRLGEVAYIVAPGNFHHLHVAACQERFPGAETWICPGVEKKRPELRFDGVLGDTPVPAWADELDQVLIHGNRWIREVAFLHRPSGTLLLVDVIENVGDHTPGVDWALKLWWKGPFRMWNRPRPAPEYRLGWKDKAAAGQSLRRILSWDFSRIVIAHGDLIEVDAKATARAAWQGVLRD
jgi:hypothetical protein